MCMCVCVCLCMFGRERQDAPICGKGSFALSSLSRVPSYSLPDSLSHVLQGAVAFVFSRFLNSSVSVCV